MGLPLPPSVEPVETNSGMDYQDKVVGRTPILGFDLAQPADGLADGLADCPCWKMEQSPILGFDTRASPSLNQRMGSRMALRNVHIGRWNSRLSWVSIQGLRQILRYAQDRVQGKTSFSCGWARGLASGQLLIKGLRSSPRQIPFLALPNATFV